MLLERPNQQDQHGGKSCDSRKDSEDAHQRDLRVAQNAKSPISEASATDAHHIHQPVSRSTDMGTSDLRKNRHIVAVEKAPSHTEKDEKSNRHAEKPGLRRVADTDHGDHNQHHADS